MPSMQIEQLKTQGYTAGKGAPLTCIAEVRDVLLLLCLQLQPTTACQICGLLLACC